MRFKRPTTTDVDMGTNIVNLVDVLLLLLIFFMISTTFTKQSQLSVQLPEATGEAITQTEKQLEIIITADSHYSINDRSLTKGDVSTIKAALQEASAGNVELPLTITADANTPNFAVVRAMDAAGQLGFTHLSLTTQTPNDHK
ncbi:MAG: biopolymer transporter ExbD [Verrucomicrobiaceae bacterium]|nr:biopolymer transporter ExbD [Verrucomicrobiaceae bacterium]